MSALGPQFGNTPPALRYRRAAPADMRRAWISDPEVEPRQQARHRSQESAEHDYWSPEIRLERGVNGRPLKKPRVGPNPNVADPHTVAFADFHDESEFHPDPHLYIDYATTRSDQTGRGHASRLIQGIADAHPEHTLDFGKVMSPKVWALKERLDTMGRRTLGRPDF